MENSKQTPIVLSDIKKETLNLIENSSLTYIMFSENQKVNEDDRLIAKLAKNAHLTIYNIVLSNIDCSLKQDIYLEDEFASVDMINVILGENKASISSNVNIYHQCAKTNSTFEAYAIAKDESFITLNNNATIVKGASKSVAKQKAKGLTLSKQAKIKAMPNLFIDEYDVIANHAASIGSVSKEDLFYLMSRGLSEKDATTLVVLGFIKPIIDKIGDIKLKEKIEQAFNKKLYN